METGSLYLVVGYDGSAPAVRALDAAVALLRGRDGSIHVVYVSQLTTAEMMSAEAIVATEAAFDQIARELHAQASKQLLDREERWRFERHQGTIAEVLAEVAGKVHEARPDDNVAIVVGSSSAAMHRVIGSAAVSLARHAPVPLLIVP